MPCARRALNGTSSGKPPHSTTPIALRNRPIHPGSRRLPEASTVRTTSAGIPSMPAKERSDPTRPAARAQRGRVTSKRVSAVTGSCTANLLAADPKR